MLIINADDFGWNKAINDAIIGSFKAGLCSSTTIASNMTGFEEACQLVRDNKISGHTGMHLVLRDGYPLTDGIKAFRIFCDNDGKLVFWKQKRLAKAFILTSPERMALAVEIRAQIRRCRDNGIPITHIDSHYHLHVMWAIAEVLISVAREERIPYVRLACNCHPKAPFYIRVYNNIFNFLLKRNSLAGTEYFGSIDDYVDLIKRMKGKPVGSMEIMIHPKLNEQGVLIDKQSGELLETAVKRVISYTESVSYSGKAYSSRIGQ